MHAFTNSAGCDSVVNLFLTVQKIDVNLQKKDESLQASGGYYYKWYQCPEWEELGSSEDSYLPDHLGEYRVVGYKGGCTDTSDCVYFDGGTVSLNYPNPFLNDVWISILYEDPVDIRLFDNQGRILFKETDIPDKFYELDFRVTHGIYYLNVQNANFSKTFKLLKVGQ